MKMRCLPLLALLPSLALPTWAGSAQQQRIPTVTRLVQTFSALESELMTAVQQGDAAATGKMLADDFELRSGAMPGVPTPRAEWLQYSQGKNSGLIEQMAVHDYSTAAVVSYLWKQEARHDIFVVDVWSKSGGTWKLSVRYASPAGDRRFTIPGAMPESPPSKKK